MAKWMRPLFFKLSAYLFPKLALQNGLEKPVFRAIFGMPLRANGDRDVAEKYLESWS